MPLFQIRILSLFLPSLYAGGLLAAFEITDVMDEDGMLTAYSVQMNIEERSGEHSKQVSGTLFWNLAGRYKRFEPDAKQPLIKRNGIPFTSDDYNRLDEILRNRDSLLGHHSLAWLGKPEGTDPAPDGISGATPKTLQRAVVKDAAWTTWILWQQANVSFTEELQRKTEGRLSFWLGAQLLNSSDMSECAFGLELLTKQQQPADEYLNLVLGALERGDNALIRSAIAYLDSATQNRQRMLIGLADSCSRMNPGYVPMVINYLKEEPVLSPEIMGRLSASLDSLPHVPVRMILEFLLEKGCYSDTVIRNVTVVKETGSSRIAELATAFLNAHEEGRNVP